MPGKKRRQNRIFQNKLLLMILLGLLFLLFIWILFVPHSKLSISDTWDRPALTEAADVEWNGTVYSRQVSWLLSDNLPKGSYTLTVAVTHASDYDHLRVYGEQAIRSVYSNSVSCALSQYGAEYEIPFENDIDGNRIYLSYYEGQPAAEVLAYNEEVKIRETNMRPGISYLRGDFAITDFRLESTALMAWQYMISCLLVLLLIGLLIYFRKRINWSREGLLLGIALFAGIPLFRGYISYGHDTLFHVSRIEGIKAGLLAGQFPVRVSAEQFGGAGYISSVLYPELLLYFPACLRLLGVPITVAYDVFWFGIHLLTAHIAYTSFFAMAKSKTSAYAGAVLFTLFPYRLSSIYLRGAMGEALAMTFFPLVLWGVCESFYGDWRKWPVAAIGYSGILQSHILTTVSIVSLSVAWGCCSIRWLWKEKVRLRCVFYMILSVFFLNAWFLIPFLMLYGLPLWVKHMKGDFLSHALYPSQLFTVFIKGNGSSMPLSDGPSADMSFSFGLGIMIGLAMILLAFLGRYFRDKKYRNICLACLAGSVLICFTTTIYFPWQAIGEKFPFFSSFTANFPWRRLGAGGFLLIAAIVIAFGQFSGFLKKMFFMLLTVGVLVSSGSFLGSYMEQNGPMITDSESYGKGTEDVLYLYYGTVRAVMVGRGNHISLSTEKLHLDSYSKSYTNLSVHYRNESETTEWIEVPLNYYPGYVAIDSSGLSLPLEMGTNWILRITVPQVAEGTIDIFYRGRRIYDGACVVSALYAVWFLWMWKRNQERRAGRIGVRGEADNEMVCFKECADKRGN